MAWGKIFLNGMNRSVWYHLASSGLLLAARSFGAGGCCLLGGWLGFLVRLTCHMPDLFDRFTPSTVNPSLTTLR